MRKTSVPPVLVAIALLAIGLLSGFTPASAVAYTPGVFPGNSWTFGDFECIGTCPQDSIKSVELEVTDVSGTIVTAAQTITYTNDTMVPSTIVSDVETGMGNGTFLVIAQGLSVGDPIFSTPGSPSPTFNATVAEPVAGAIREVNVVEFAFVGAGLSERLAWDKETGILVELRVTTLDGIETARVTQTNIWSLSSLQDVSITTTPLTIVGVLDTPGSFTIEVTSINGYAGTLELSTSFVPPGLAVSLSDDTVTLAGGETKDVTLTVSTATNGAFIVTINADDPAQSVARYATVTFIVQPRFTLDVSPASITVPMGVEGDVTARLTSVNNFSGNIAIYAYSLPLGPDVSLNVTSVELSPGSSAGVAVTVNSASQGTFEIYLTAFSGEQYELVVTAVVQVTVTGPPDFALSADPQGLSITRGSTGQSTISIASLTGYQGEVFLSASVAPALDNGPVPTLSLLSVDLTPDSTASVTLTVSTTPLTVAPQLYTVTVTGTDGAVTHDTIVYVYVTKVVPTLVTALKNGDGQPVTSIIVGTEIHDTAVLSGGAATMTGTVTYNYYINDLCSGTPGSTQTVEIATGNIVPDSAPVTPQPGSYSFQAIYSGDANNSPASGPCEQLTVNKASPSLAIILSSTSILPGGQVTGSATLTGRFQAGGSVTYSYYTGGGCKGTGIPVGTPVAVTGGIVPGSDAQTFNTAGIYSWKAVYSGDENNNSVTSSCEPLTVAKTSPTITAELSATTIVVGDPVTSHAVLQGGLNAGGTVNYYYYSNGSCDGASTLVSTAAVTNGAVPDSSPQTFNTVGQYSWKASYTGDENNNPVTSSCQTVTVNPRPDFSITGTETVNLTVGSQESATITVSPANGFTGTVTLTVAVSPATGLTCNTLAAVAEAGTRTLTCSGALPGTYTVTLTGTSGGLSHEKTITYQVAPEAQVPEQLILGLAPFQFYALISGVAVAIVAAGGLALMRRNKLAKA